ncbi:MAG: DUF86 domain-containing protein [Anaerolineales bacterium]|nr:DUF86 domain-containing protein [Anaerolineales bacterium]
MSKHESSIRYRHMLDTARKASELMRGKTRADLDDEGIETLALVRLLEVVGEAANRIPDDEQSRHPEIPWTQIVGLRNRLIHGYDSIDLDILWQVVSEDLPPLIQSLEKIVAGIG